MFWSENIRVFDLTRAIFLCKRSQTNLSNLGADSVNDSGIKNPVSDPRETPYLPVLTKGIILFTLCDVSLPCFILMTILLRCILYATQFFFLSKQLSSFEYIYNIMKTSPLVQW